MWSKKNNRIYDTCITLVFMRVLRLRTRVLESCRKIRFLNIRVSKCTKEPTTWRMSQLKFFDCFFHVSTFLLAGIVTNSEKRISWSFSVFPKSKNLNTTILLNSVIPWKYPKTSRDTLILVYFSFFSQSPRFIWYLRKKALLPYSEG